MNIRKIFIPVIAGFLTSPAAFAAILDDDGAGPSTTWYYSDEFLSTAVPADEVTSGAISVMIEAEYAVGDVVTLAVSGSAIESGFPTSVIVLCADNTNSGITFGLLSSDADGAVYRVTELDAGTCVNATTTVDVVVPFTAGLQMNAEAVDLANTITVGFSAETGTGLGLDTAGGLARSGDLIVTGSEYAVSVPTPFDGVIDVENNRETFEGFNPVDWTVWQVLPQQVPTGGVDAATFSGFGPSSQEVSVAGDWSFIQDTDAGTADIQANPGVVATSCVGAATVTASSISATCNLGGQILQINNGPNVDGNGDAVAIADGSFVSTHVLTFDGIGGVTSSITVSNISLGEWVLNGFSADIAYMPFGTNIGQIIYLANRGSQTGAITVEWIDQNGASGSFDIGSIAAGSTKKLGQLIQNGLPAAQRASGRLALTIIANVPSCDAQLNAQYNVSGDRAFSVSKSNCTP